MWKATVEQPQEKGITRREFVPRKVCWRPKNHRHTADPAYLLRCPISPLHVCDCTHEVACHQPTYAARCGGNALRCAGPVSDDVVVLVLVLHSHSINSVTLTLYKHEVFSEAIQRIKECWHGTFVYLSFGYIHLALAKRISVSSYLTSIIKVEGNTPKHDSR
jgi:hypothetical protein